jgi:hypothetical protein
MTRIVRETGDEGIRSYGPGKFHTLIDSYAFEVAGDGIDEEVSVGEGGGWYGLVLLDGPTRKRVAEVATENKDELTEDEQELLDDSVAVIFFERSDGTVEADWFEDKEKADEAWADIEADTEEEEEEEEDDEEEEEKEEEDDDFDLEGEMEEGAVISDARGGGYQLTFSGKKVGGKFDDFDEAVQAAAQKMVDDNFSPNLFYVNDHGNIDLLEVSFEVARGKVRNVQNKTVRSWV